MSLTPISQLKDLINERTGSDPTGFNKFFKINPRVDDIPDRFSIQHEGVRLLVLGTVDTAGSGCVCPEHVILKRVLSHLVYQRDDVVVMDMEAGLEHLGRGTASGMDVFITVVEPGGRSLQTYRKVKELAAGLGIEKVLVVANKVRTPEEENFIRENVPEDRLLGIIHWSAEVSACDMRGGSPYDQCPAILAEIKEIKSRLDKS